MLELIFLLPIVSAVITFYWMRRDPRVREGHREYFKFWKEHLFAGFRMSEGERFAWYTLADFSRMELSESTKFILYVSKYHFGKLWLISGRSLYRVRNIFWALWFLGLTTATTYYFWDVIGLSEAFRTWVTLSSGVFALVIFCLIPAILSAFFVRNLLLSMSTRHNRVYEYESILFQMTELMQEIKDYDLSRANLEILSKHIDNMTRLASRMQESEYFRHNVLPEVIGKMSANSSVWKKLVNEFPLLDRPSDYAEIFLRWNVTCLEQFRELTHAKTLELERYIRSIKKQRATDLSEQKSAQLELMDTRLILLWEQLNR